MPADGDGNVLVLFEQLHDPVEFRIRFGTKDRQIKIEEDIIQPNDLPDFDWCDFQIARVEVHVLGGEPDPDVAEGITLLAEAREAFGPAVPTERNPAKRMAQEFEGTPPGIILRSIDFRG